jgi:WD40 repeat protein
MLPLPRAVSLGPRTEHCGRGFSSDSSFVAPLHTFLITIFIALFVVCGLCQLICLVTYHHLLFLCLQHIEWSPDSQYILCALYQYSTVQVFSLRNHDWKCNLKDTVSGIVDVWWSPDSRHILTCAEFHVSKKSENKRLSDNILVICTHVIH